MSNVWNWSPYPPEWSSLLLRLQQNEQLLAKLGDQLMETRKQLDELKAKPPLHVEYHFDQLKVNRLEGTLNVGLSPQGVCGIDSFDSPVTGCWNVAQDSSPSPAAAQIESMQAEMAHYMDESAPGALAGLEQAYGIPLDADLRNKVIADVKRQLNERIQYYATVAPYPSDGTNDERKQWSDDVKQKTYRDIQAAFSAYLQKQKPTNGPRSEY